MIEVKFDDTQVQSALKRLEGVLGNLKPALKDSVSCFCTPPKNALPPAPRPMASNKASTMAMYVRRLTGKRPSNNAASISKKPLVGESKRLSNEIHSRATRDSVQVHTSVIYAAMQQFGAKRHQFKGVAPWGDVPARPFMACPTPTNKIYSMSSPNTLKMHFASERF